MSRCSERSESGWRLVDGLMCWPPAVDGRTSGGPEGVLGRLDAVREVIGVAFAFRKKLLRQKVVLAPVGVEAIDATRYAYAHLGIPTVVTHNHSNPYSRLGAVRRKGGSLRAQRTAPTGTRIKQQRILKSSVPK